MCSFPSTRGLSLEDAALQRCRGPVLTAVEGPRLVWTLIKGNLTKMEWGGPNGGPLLCPTEHQGLSVTDPAEESLTGKTQFRAPPEKVHIATPTRKYQPQRCKPGTSPHHPGLLLLSSGLPFQTGLPASSFLHICSSCLFVGLACGSALARCNSVIIE